MNQGGGVNCDAGISVIQAAGSAACTIFAYTRLSPLALQTENRKIRPVLQPKTIQKIGTELAIAWPDGQETYIPLETLRRACPCASCGCEPDVLGRLIRPDVSYSAADALGMVGKGVAAASFDLSGWETVGGYGIQPRWADGHRTGIYTFAYLQRLGSAA